MAEKQSSAETAVEQRRNEDAKAENKVILAISPKSEAITGT